MPSGSNSSGPQSFLPDIHGNGNKSNNTHYDYQITYGSTSSRVSSRGGPGNMFDSTMLLTVTSLNPGVNYGRRESEHADDGFASKTISLTRVPPLTLGSQQPLQPSIQNPIGIALDLQGITNKDAVKAKKSARADKKKSKATELPPKVSNTGSRKCYFTLMLMQIML